MKKVLSIVLTLCLVVTTFTCLLTMQVAGIRPEKVVFTRRADDAAFGTYSADENSKVQYIADNFLSSSRWIFTHSQRNATAIRASFDKPYKVKSVTICSSTDSGTYANRSVWHAIATYGEQGQTKTLFDKSDLHANDAANLISGLDSDFTEYLDLNLYGPGVTAAFPEGGADTEGGTTHRMAIQYITFTVEGEYEPEQNVVLDFESLDGITTTHSTTAALDTEDVCQGNASLKMGFTTNTGSDDRIGAEAVCTLAQSIDLSSYDYFTIDVFFPSYFWNRQGIKLKFESTTDDECSYSANFKSWSNYGWEQLTFGKNNCDVQNMDWKHIKKITISYVNIDQYAVSNGYIAVDNLCGHTGGYTPDYDERGLFVLDDFESVSNITGIDNTSAELNNESDDITNGQYSLKLNAVRPTKNQNNIGVQAMINYQSPVDLSDFEYFSFDLILSQNFTGTHRLGINFITDFAKGLSDGYNAIIDFSDQASGLHTITLTKSQLTKAIASADMSSISAISFTWYNDAKRANIVSLTLDDFIAYNEGDLENADYGNFDSIVNVTMGDADDDKVITAVDALIALKASIGIDTGVSQRQLGNANVDRDDSLTGIDALYILKRAADRIACFPDEKGYYNTMKKLYGNKSAMQFDEDGEFKILSISDLHIAEHYDGIPNEYIIMLNSVLKKAAPDLVVLNGDTFSDGLDRYSNEYGPCRNIVREYMSALNLVFKQYNAKWTLTFGNHDPIQGNINPYEQISIAKEFDCFVGDYGYTTQGRYANTVIPILTSDGNEVGFNAWFIDTGNAHDSTTNCADVTDKEIKWYKSTSNEYKKSNNGATIYGCMFGHIRTNEFAIIALNPTKYNMKGSQHECTYKENLPTSKLCSAFLEQGDIKGYYIGHDHINNFSGVYQGIEFGYDGNLTVDGYGGVYGVSPSFPETCGGRLVTINENNPSGFVSEFVQYTR